MNKIGKFDQKHGLYNINLIQNCTTSHMPYMTDLKKKM